MKKYKAITALLLIVIMLINTFPVIAVEAASFEVETVTAQAGKTVDVKISVKNSPGITSTKLTITFDETLILESVTYGTEITGNFIKPKKMTSPVILNWANGLEDFSGDYVFATLSFRIAADAQIGLQPITVTYDPDDVYNIEETNADFTIINGGITVVCPHTNTTNVPEEPADCDEGGYTAGVWCNDCEIYISGHEPIPATGNHTDADGQWESNEVNHFRTCACGHIFDAATHNGGTATCKEKAKCSVCGTEYGQLNAANHAGGTTTVNASEPNHKTQQAGYTGDTKCLGCGEIIAYGQPIEPGAHTPADVWSNDETHHWKECNIVGCGVVIDGSKELHSSDKAENKVTCQKQAVCDICGVSYGSVAEHDYTADDKKQDALKTEGNCRDEAVYYYSCSVCGLVENNDTHTFLGDKVATTHVGGTTTVNASAADHKTQTDGYTGDTKCLGCNEIIAYGQAIPAGAHNPANTWTTDETHHWKECTVVGCGVVIDDSKTAHTSTGANVATCQKEAVCDICGASYGTVAEHDFADSLSKDASGHWYACQTAGCTEKDGFAQHTPDHDGGATEDYAIKCAECQYEIEAQLGHTHVFDKEVVDTRYEASKASCSAAATYYYSCKCGEKGTATFSYGEPNEHTEGISWKSDETHHWKECTVVGCGVVIDGTKAAHTSTGENVATCQKQAVCDICGVSYGTVADHNFATTLSKDATGHWYACQTTGCTEKDGFAQHTPDHDGGATEDYAIKCTVCQYEIEAQLGHTHVFDKEVAEEQYLASKANCTDPAKYYKSCKCGEKGTDTFTSGEKLGHTEGTAWEKDATGHWHTCTVAGCGVIIDTSKAEHTPDREAATETDPIKCSVCGYEIAPVLAHTHAYGTEWKSDKDNHWNECVCGDKANTVAHKDENTDGKCDTCEYVVSVPDNDNPQTGDNSMISLWIILLCVSGLGIVVTTVFRKKKMF
ncbi:MAG: sortase B protein-sorting domain-containing protein [Clostridia bacterium]|nr:sortase B protein-sorting domain-containing protein [Clostridia bacterium]